MTIKYEIPADATTFSAEGVEYTYQDMSTGGGRWTSSKGATLVIKAGIVRSFEHGGSWCTLVGKVDTKKVTAKYNHGADVVADETVRAWIAAG